MARILLTGAGGQFGQQFLQDFGNDVAHAVYHSRPEKAPRVPHLVADLADAGHAARVVEKSRPDWVVHAAALTNVEACEKDPAGAMRNNRDATHYLATAAHRGGAKFLQISTDYVFDGRRGSYKETDATNPINAYGKSKLAAEQAASHIDPNNVVARTAVVFGPHKTNFVRWVVGELQAGRSIRAATDQIVNPTCTRDLAAQVHALVRDDVRGVFHCAGATSLSRRDMAHEIASVFALDAALIQDARIADIPLVAPRPRDTSLDVSKASAHERPMAFRDALRRLKEDLRV